MYTKHHGIEYGKTLMQADDVPITPVATKDNLSDPEDAGHSNGVAPISCRILVVDDNIINCQVAVHVLQKFSSQVESTTASRDAVDMHIRQGFDLILMDCQMPGLDGYQTTALIRAADAGSRNTSIIGWTSTLNADERIKCMNAGMDDLITKPISREAVQKMLAQWAQPASSLRFPAPTPAENNLIGTWQLFGPNFAELAALFQTDTPKRIAAMRRAAADGDVVTIAKIAHILAGSCASMGALRLASMCRNLELCCKAAISTYIEQLLEEIQVEYSEIEAKIDTLLQSVTL